MTAGDRGHRVGADRPRLSSVWRRSHLGQPIVRLYNRSHSMAQAAELGLVMVPNLYLLAPHADFAACYVHR
jgi:hypothetical protein